MDLFFPPLLAWDPFEEFPLPPPSACDPLDEFPFPLDPSPLSAFPEFPFPLPFFAKAVSGASANVAAAPNVTINEMAVATDARRFLNLRLVMSAPKL
ncbi:hypothetical protein [Ruegeria sp. HKCCD4332]|uniref:hypothetical protein n=1 Tax=Ruegeria sp. HKCCD4332 TaxID=2683021 RepID=UPI0014922166|nr:hypothetical protein [Ruegeria sp. HKCCD4332]NOD78101.1 hypothetical protein [Ruegeria sp. HKCCD4332]